MPKLRNSFIRGGASKVLQFDQGGEFFFRRGLDRLGENDLPNAIQNYRRALHLDPENAEIKLAIAEALSEMSRYEESNRTLLTLFSSDSERPSECYFGMGCNFVGLQQYEHARDSFLRYLEVDPEGEFIMETYEMLDSLEQQQGLVDVRHIRAQELAEKSKRLMDGEEFAAAIEVLEELNELAPNEAYVCNNLALARFCMHDYEKAIQLVSQVLKTEPLNVQARCNLAMFLHISNGGDAARKEIQKVLQLRLEETDDIHHAVVTLMELGDFAAAYPLQKRLFLRMPYDTGVIHRLAVCAYEVGNYRHAAGCYDRLVKLDEGDSVARYYRGVCRAAATGAAEPTKLMFSYQVPLEEVLKRIKRINELLNKPHSELKRMWEDGAELHRLLRWASELNENAVKHAVLVLVASFKDCKAELFLRNFLLQQNQPDALKRGAFGLLKQVGAKEPYLGYMCGELVESRVNLVRALPEDAPAPYSKVLEVCFLMMAKAERPENCILHTVLVWSRYVAALSARYPRLGRPRVQAFAAALEYLACREVGLRVTKASLCRKYQVTISRFNRALEKLAPFAKDEEET